MSTSNSASHRRNIYFFDLYAAKAGLTSLLTLHLAFCRYRSFQNLSSLNELNAIGILSHLSVSLEATGGLAGGQIPQAKGLIPGSGQGVVAIRGEHHVADEVRVSVETLLGVAVVGVLVAGQLPHDQGFVCESRWWPLIYARAT